MSTCRERVRGVERRGEVRLGEEEERKGEKEG
jgi:hypothetical protein